MTKTHELIYIGRRLSGNVLKHFYIEGDQAVTYKRVLVPAANIGAIIEVTEGATPNSISLGREDGPRIIGYSEDKMQVLEWESLSAVDVTVHTRRRREKEMNRAQVTELESAMNVLRAATVTMNRTNRAAFTAWVLEQLL